MTQGKKAKDMLDQLKEQYPKYYNNLYTRCKSCRNILSSMQCEMCEEFDMYESIEEER